MGEKTDVGQTEAESYFYRVNIWLIRIPSTLINNLNYYDTY